jgi:capsid protein
MTKVYYNKSAYEGSVAKYKEDRQRLYDGTPDQVAVNEILLLQLRVAHAYRNSGYAKTAVNKYVTNLGSLQVHWIDKNTKEPVKEMQELWEEFASNPMLDGYGDLKTWQSVSNFSRFLTGASFTRLHIRRKGNKNKIPLKLENISSRLHDISYFGVNSQTDVKFGIQFSDSKPENYFFRLDLFEEFPYKANINTIDPVTIPAKELLHSFIRTSPGQWIGIPELAAILVSLYKIEDLVDVTVAKQATSQAISIIVTGGSPLNQLPIGGIRKIDEAMNREIDEDSSSENEKIELRTTGTNVIYPKKGENVNVFQGADIGNNLLGLIEIELRKICAACDTPYHQVTGDYKGIDFSTLRGILIELRNRIEYIHHFYTIPLEMYPLTKYFKELASVYIKGEAFSNAIPTFQFPMFRGVDDLKEAQADQLEMQNGFGLLKDKLNERHLTFEELQEDLRKRKSLLDEFGLDLISSTKKGDQTTNTEANSNSTTL